MPALGDLELQVMRRIWARRGPVTVRDVLDDLQRDRNIAYTTVMTVMGNLEKRGWLTIARLQRILAAQPPHAGLARPAAIAGLIPPVVITCLPLLLATCDVSGHP